MIYIITEVILAPSRQAASQMLDMGMALDELRTQLTYPLSNFSSIK
jgi:hypothetical protein